MDMLEIDGSQGEGGGQILRTSVSLSCILGKPIHIFNIRAARAQPGLRPQHLNALTSAAEICNSKLKGAAVGSTEIELFPGETDKQVSKRIDTGTAGSITLIAQTLIPIAMFRGLDMDVQMIGGTEVPFSPTIDYLQRVVVPAYTRIGGDVSVDVKRRGYYPRGGGIARVRVGRSSKPRALDLVRANRDFAERVKVLSCSRSLPAHVVERQASEARKILQQAGLEIESSDVDSMGESSSPGSSILIYTQSNSTYVGSDALGARNKRAEEVGAEAAKGFLEEASANPNLDSHLADMIVTLLSCVKGKSQFVTSKITNHLKTNLDVAHKLTGGTFSMEKTEEMRAWRVSLSGLSEKSN